MCANNDTNSHKLSNSKPCISIGMPVFNGERYIELALDSILSQTFPDFELIISDNASTDRTQQICQEYKSKDDRIRYYRNEKNLGAPRNYNRVFELSLGEYFKWAAYDDVIAPDFLKKCVEVLEKHPSYVLCHSKIGVIDEHGSLVGNCDHRTMTKIGSKKAHERFGDLISIRNPCFALFGVIRASEFRKTPLHGSYIGADRNLLAEIGLLGRIYEIPEHLFFRRDHPEAYTRRFCEDNKYNYREKSAWWSKDYYTDFPNWKDCYEFFRSVKRVRLGWLERILCYDQIFRWFINEGFIFMENDIENLLLWRSRLCRKLIPTTKLNLERTVIPVIRKLRK
jgi:glycosyltransferase involved in cell wall biosynthesis